MKILLTGLPKSGKTTLLTNLIDNIEVKRGMIAQEKVEDNRRIGFNLLDNRGNRAILATTNAETIFPVGRFFVDVASVDSFSASLLNFSFKELLYIDEIGQMQLYSESFKELAESYLNSSNDYVGTISAIYKHPFILKVKLRQDILFCTVTLENRQELHAALSEAIANRELFNNLSLRQQSVTLDLARHYLAEDQYVSLKKLFHNALRYVVKKKVVLNIDGSYAVIGDHSRHSVRKDNLFQCDCDFFNGGGKFKDRAGECSHIQSIKIVNSQT